MYSNKDQKQPKRDPLREHDLSRKLVKDGKPVEYLTIKGYVGKSDSNDIVRLYMNKEFSDYIDIQKNDILHAEEIPNEDIEFGGTCVWVKKDAQLTQVRIESKKQQARFMEGDIARAQLKREYAEKGIGPIQGAPISRLILCQTRDFVKCGSLFAPVCPSEFVPCTFEFHCPVVDTAVGSNCRTPLCESVAICPSVRFRCPSEFAFCTPNCETVVGPEIVIDPLTQLKEQMEKLKAKINKLEKEKE